MKTHKLCYMHSLHSSIYRLWGNHFSKQTAKCNSCQIIFLNPNLLLIHGNSLLPELTAHGTGFPKHPDKPFPLLDPDKPRAHKSFMRNQGQFERKVFPSVVLAATVREENNNTMTKKQAHTLERQARPTSSSVSHRLMSSVDWFSFSSSPC